MSPPVRYILAENSKTGWHYLRGKGPHTVTATDGVNSQSSVITVIPATAISPTTVRVGDQVTVNGTGFGAGSMITIRFDSIVVAITASESNGVFSTTFNVPPGRAGTHSVAASDGTNSQSSELTVVSSLAVTPTTVHVGDQVTLTGRGFGATRTVTVQFDSTTVNTTTSTSDGSFTLLFIVPAGRTGGHIVTTSDGVNSLTANLSVTQFITVSPASVRVGDAISVNGTGFGSNETVIVQFDGVTLISVNSSTAGSFTTVFSTPASQTGAHTITANDGAVSHSSGISVRQFLTVNPTSPHVADAITAGGTGFGAGRTVIIQFDGTTVTSTNTSTVGSFTTVFNIPASQSGIHNVTANDGLVSQSLIITVTPLLKSSIASGHVGEQVQLTGTGFASAKSVAILYDNAGVATFQTDTTGTFMGVFNIPASQAGTNVVTAGDGQNNLSLNITVVPLITLGPPTGIPGSPVTFRGTGFASNRGISLSFSDAILLTNPASVISDIYGSFSGNFTVPWSYVNSYKVTASDAANSASATFALITSFNLIPASGNVSSIITVNGSGYSGLVTIKYDGTTVASTTAGTNGIVMTTFTVPASVFGGHNVTVNDATTTLQSPFVMESIPPPSTKCVLFLKGPKQGQRPNFVWQPVSDASGVTYWLQIGADAEFTTILLEKKGLTATEYRPSDTEKLLSSEANSPYYWRVKAVDGAANEGDWSIPTSFSVSFLPDWAKYTLIGVGSIAAGAIIFLLGFRAGRRPKAAKTVITPG